MCNVFQTKNKKPKVTMPDFETKDGLMLLLGLVILVATASVYDLMSIEIVENNLEPFAQWLIVGGILIAYFYSEREIGDLQDHELGFTVTAIGVLWLYKYSSAIDQIFADYQPYSGFAMLLITLGAFYALSTNMSLTSTVLEMIVGAMLLTAAMVEFNIGEITVLGDEISQYAIWIFVLGFFLAYVIVERDIGDLSNAELIAFGLGFIPFFLYETSTNFQETVTNSNPELGLLLTAFVGIAYWVIKNDGEVITFEI